jgi:hypothetical protein
MARHVPPLGGPHPFAEHPHTRRALPCSLRLTVEPGPGLSADGQDAHGDRDAADRDEYRDRILPRGLVRTVGKGIAPPGETGRTARRGTVPAWRGSRGGEAPKPVQLESSLVHIDRRRERDGDYCDGHGDPHEANLLCAGVRGRRVTRTVAPGAIPRDWLRVENPGGPQGGDGSRGVEPWPTSRARRSGRRTEASRPRLMADIIAGLRSEEPEAAGNPGFQRATARRQTRSSCHRERSHS